MSQQPSKEALRSAQWQQALQDGQADDMQKDSSELLIRGVEQTKKQIQKSLLGYHYEKRRDENGDIKTVKVVHYTAGRSEDGGVPDSRQLCNEKAVADFMATVEGVVNINTLGSNLSDKNISDLGEDVMLAIVEKITLNRDEYGIESTSDASQIVSIISTNVMAALRKARHARFLQHDEETRQVKRIETAADEDDKRFL